MSYNIVLTLTPTLHEGYIVLYQCTEWVWKIFLLTLAASRGVADLYLHNEKTWNTREFFFVKLSINNGIVGFVSQKPYRYEVL